MNSSANEGDSRRLWQGLKAVTGYKNKQNGLTNTTATLPDELNRFYACFKHVVEPSAQHECIVSSLNEPVHQVTEDDVRRVFKSVKAGKATGPDGIPSCVLKFCYSQLSSVFTDIFNLSLSLCVVPTCFKKSIIVPVRKKHLHPV